MKTRKYLDMEEKPNQARETEGSSLRAKPFSLTNGAWCLLGKKKGVWSFPW